MNFTSVLQQTVKPHVLFNLPHKYVHDLSKVISVVQHFSCAQLQQKCHMGSDFPLQYRLKDWGKLLSSSVSVKRALKSASPQQKTA